MTIRDNAPVGRGAVARRAFLAGFAATAITPLLGGCRGSPTQEDAVTATTRTGSVVEFPPPVASSVVLERTLERRRSVRAFTPAALTDAEVGQLLWAAQGVTAAWGGRTAPSAGALYPLELHAVTPGRTLRYLPDQHRAEVVTDADLRPDLMAAAGGQEAVGAAPLVVAVVGVPARTATKYGDRATRYVDLEAGHAAQNLLLQAVALDLGAVPIGAFTDDEVARVLALPGGHHPRYLIPVGHPG
ncbi:MAG: SagB/ThcOx family dehydrogenase [Acidimicrobiales bacterium]|nr:SagB/ThcOx family dehydrogenase [Acidimicrobiales bacterium]